MLHVAESIELDPVEWITAGAVGEPGRRTFYVQARGGGEIVALLVEKGQVQGLAQLARELLARSGVRVTSEDLDKSAQQLVEPVMATWRAGRMSLGMDRSGVRFLLEAQEYVAEPEASTEEPATARFWMTREQLVRLAAYAAYVVEAGARPSCRLCGRPIDPVTGHVCPASNGHGPLTT
jgi:uncharacterized repeat protein (TIGR03847 family)